MMADSSETLKSVIRATGADTPTIAPLTSYLEATIDGNISDDFSGLANEEIDDDEVRWYPLYIWHATARKALMIRDALYAHNFTTYLRLQQKEVMTRDANGRNRICQIQTPILSNLIFVKAKKKILRVLKNTDYQFSSLQFVTKPKTDRFEKAQVIFVRDKDMDSFIAAESRLDPNRQRIPLDPSDYIFKPGKKVRIIGGPFAGVIGETKHIKGRRIIAVKLANLGLAVGLAYVSKDDLEPYTDDPNAISSDISL